MVFSMVGLLWENWVLYFAGLMDITVFLYSGMSMKLFNLSFLSWFFPFSHLVWFYSSQCTLYFCRLQCMDCNRSWFCMLMKMISLLFTKEMIFIIIKSITWRYKTLQETIHGKINELSVELKKKKTATKLVGTHVSGRQIQDPAETKWPTK